jgi:tRNA(adenine34) deaminase
LKPELNKNDFFINCAISEAEKAAAIGEVPVGAVIVCEGKIIARGHNRCIIDNDPSAHAEIVAVRKAAKKIKNYRLCGMELFVTLEPCLMCIGVLLNARIRKIVFASADKKAGACGSVFNLACAKQLNHKIEIETANPVLQKQCSKMLKDFFAKKR